MPLQIVRNSIINMSCDAIVNPTNEKLLPYGGTDKKIHDAAGPELLKRCREKGFCKTGRAFITPAYELPCEFVIHTVGPVWNERKRKCEALLRSCYQSCLSTAKENGCESIAFPLISSGSFGFPKDLALKIAIDEITSFLYKNDMLIYIVVYDSESFEISSKLFGDIKEYIDVHYIDETANRQTRFLYDSDYCYQRSREMSNDAMFEECSLNSIPGIEDALSMIDESFSQMLLRKIDEKGLTDAQCYKKANIDRKLFSKIRINPDYKPRKQTVIAFAVALELSLDETEEMLLKAGYALSHSSKFDIIIEYFIKNKNYNIFEINEALFSFDQVLLGS